MPSLSATVTMAWIAPVISDRLTLNSMVAVLLIVLVPMEPLACVPASPVVSSTPSLMTIEFSASLLTVTEMVSLSDVELSPEAVRLKLSVPYQLLAGL